MLRADVAGTSLTANDLNDGMEAAKLIIEARLNPFGVSGARVSRSGTDELVVEVPGISVATAKDITRPAVLMFCEALRQGGQGQSNGTSTSVAVVPSGTQVYYKPFTCQPDVDADGNVAVVTGTGEDRQQATDANGNIVRVQPQYVLVSALNSQMFESVVWTPAKGDLNGVPTIMTGSYLKSNAQVVSNSLGAPVLQFSMTKDGEQIFGSLSQRLIGMPLATFLDGDPVRGAQGQILAPTIQSMITDSGQTTGLSLADAKRLRTFLNNGAFPITIKVVEAQEFVPE